MSAHNEIIHRAFLALWDKANKDRHRSLHAESSMIWLEDVGWETLFPDHCFRCHGFEDGPCEAPYGHGPFGCPGCVKEEQEHQQRVQAAMVEPPSFKLRKLLSLCRDHDDDEACTVACRIKDSE